MVKTKNIAVFLDRDGTILKEVGYLSRLEDMELLPQAIAAIKLLNQKGIKAVVVTNQSGVARGFFLENLVKEVHQRLQKALQKEGASLDGFFYCPHHPDYGHEKYRKDCFCRKPNIGMLQEAARDFRIDLSRSYLIGDTRRDLETAWNAGMKGVLVLSGYGKDELKKIEVQNPEGKPDYVASDLLRAVRWVIEDIEKGKNENPHN
ncbi:MAG: HAD family hydrolase [Deltaproteobacteria bacterium]|nr:HAD family hydrolase [Deltaproteobacteria bacterium]